MKSTEPKVSYMETDITRYPLSNSYLLHSEEVDMWSFDAPYHHFYDCYIFDTTQPSQDQQVKTYDASSKEGSSDKPWKTYDFVYDENEHIGNFINSLLADGLDEKYFIVFRKRSQKYEARADTFIKMPFSTNTIACSAEVTTNSHCFKTVLGMICLTTTLLSITPLEPSPLHIRKKKHTVLYSVAFGLPNDNSLFTEGCKEHRHPLALLMQHLESIGESANPYEIVLTKDNLIRLLYSGKL